MSESSLRADTLARLHLNKLSEQVEGTIVEIGAKLAEFLVASPRRKRHLHLRQILQPLPSAHIRSTEQFKDLEQLSNFRVALEKRTVMSYFKENCTYRPHVYT